MPILTRGLVNQFGQAFPTGRTELRRQVMSAIRFRLQTPQPFLFKGAERFADALVAIPQAGGNLPRRQVFFAIHEHNLAAYFVRVDRSKVA